LADPRLDPAEVTAERELARRVREAVDDLPPGQRDAILLFYFAGLTQREMALLLGMQVGAVKVRLHRGRAALRRHLHSVWKEDQVEEGTIEMRPAEVLRLPAEADRPPEFVIMLEEIAGGRRLPIWVGHSEATWLAMTVEEIELPRPGPYAMIANLLAGLHSRVREVRIERLVGSTYYAVVVAEREGVATRIDARPSDALNLAVLTGSPILVAADLPAGPGVDDHGPDAEKLTKHLGEGTAAVAATIASEAKAAWEESLKPPSKGEEL
jgi:bifunctional DNase/RNase